MPKGQTVSDTAKSGTVTKNGKSPAEHFRDVLDLEADSAGEFGGSAEDVMNAVIGKMLEASTWDEAVAAQDATLPSGKDLVDVEHIVRDLQILRSEERFRKGLGFYARVEAEYLETGEEFQYTVGAANVVTLLWLARQRDELPKQVVITSRETASGELLMLRPVAKRAK